MLHPSSLLTAFLSQPRLNPDLAVGLSLLPFHFVELGLEGFVLIGQHLQAVLQGRALLLITANQLAVDLVLERNKGER